ncbi:allantoate amidohydrolase [Granulicella sp. WH15]|uniref:allantoate amidohydrolase n=1 Tax=Granulicella sp. WH15 TaxID=2602070 RepID=UPI001366D575|nr:allantoate amidohydrolase [Granulicella sp. WH15]QHN04272.1 allantoate amidohydrolase [Granulicella sp. WH15]
MTHENKLAFAAQAEQIIARCRELARITDVPGQTNRQFLTPATREAHALVRRWMLEAGLHVTIDAVGNLHAIHPGTEHKPRLIVGSHLDTVVDAGAFDGPLGILMGLSLIESVDPAELPFAIELIAFSEEEGVRFRHPFLGSLALIGEPAPHTLTDADGITLDAAIAIFGHQPTAPAALAPSAFAYLEFHIEQGPVLEAESRPLAAVSTIAGQSRLSLTFHGRANHAGATPMRLRHDALAATAHWITLVEAHALAQPGLVATVGSIEAKPGLGNVIPGQVTASLDLRHADDAVRHATLAVLLEAAQHAATRRGVTCTVQPLVDQPAVPMHPHLIHLLVEAARISGFDASPIPSGAGHDAMILARRIPAAMLFLRTPGGLSHHPDEAVHAADVEAALITGVAFLNSLSPTEVAHA